MDENALMYAHRVYALNTFWGDRYQIDTVDWDMDWPQGGRAIAKGILLLMGNYTSSLAGLTLEVLSLHPHKTGLYIKPALVT